MQHRYLLISDRKCFMAHTEYNNPTNKTYFMSFVKTGKRSQADASILR